MLTQEQLEALLQRPLTQTEIDYLSLYLDIAEEALEELICTPVQAESGTRTFTTRRHYSTAFVDIFRSVSEVKLNGKVITDYKLMQWDKHATQDWYNSLVFDNRICRQELEVTAEWGFVTLPSDLQLLLAGLFDQNSSRKTFDSTIASKQVEDFRISYRAGAITLDQAFMDKYGSIVDKYSLCNIPNVDHGQVRCKC